jgi:ParB-like chromosome segregation protein Spo0J
MSHSQEPYPEDRVGTAPEDGVGTATHLRRIKLDRLVTDPAFGELFPQEPQTIRRIVASMREHGFDRSRPIDVWRRRGQLVVVEGHQRYVSARLAGLSEVYVVYRSFASDTAALEWAFEQQRARRNISKEAQCLYYLRMLERSGRSWDSSPKMAERSGFSTATIDRARQVLTRGTESEVAMVGDGYGLKEAYARILEREQEERQRLVDPPRRAVPIPKEEEPPEELPEVEDPEPDTPELGNLREALDAVAEAVDAATELFGRDSRHVFGATVGHRRSLIRDVANAARRMSRAWEAFEKVAPEGER